MRFATQTSGKAKITWKQTSANTAAGLTAANIVNSSGQRAIGALITVETKDIRFTLDSENVPTGSGGADFGHILAAGESIALDSPDHVKDFSFCSKTAGEHGVIHVTSFFAKL